MTTRFFRVLIALAVSALVSSCAAQREYHELPTGTFSGNLQLRWIGPDRFVFVPDSKNPFEFKRANGDVIRPGPMYTDGGSIPRPLWNNPDLSPWGLAPAYIVHDWLFYIGQEKLPGSEKYNLENSAQVLAEAAKTLMEEHENIERKPVLVYAMKKAASGDTAAEKWIGAGVWHTDLPNPLIILEWGIEIIKELPIPGPD